MKIITGKVRFSYANVWEPKSINGGVPKYSVSIIIPKTDEVTLKKINVAIEVAKNQATAKFGDKILNNFKLPLRDGDVERIEDEAYAGSYFINTLSIMKPGIVDENVQAITDQSQFYSGCYGRASLVFYAYNAEGNKGIACGLRNLQKLEDGEILSAYSSAEEDFDDVEDYLG